jgi:hypothetical protein
MYVNSIGRTAAMSRANDPGPEARDLPEPDTTAELWDRIGDDLANQGRPCLETVERLVDEACHRGAGTPAQPGPAPEACPCPQGRK